MIDWFTVIAQIVNFLVLVALLRHFLYGRILAAMDARDEQVSAKWDEAELSKQRAAGELEQACEENRRLDERRQELLGEIRQEVEQHRQQLNADVRAEAEEIRARWGNALREEINSFLRDLKRRASEEICSIARKALADLADVELERQVVRRFLEKFERLEQHARKEIAQAFEGGGRTAIVSTSYELPDELQSAVSETLRRLFFQDLEVNFHVSPDLLCGIALQTDAHTLAWDLRDYLVSLEQQLQKTLEEEVTSQRPRSHEPVSPK